MRFEVYIYMQHRCFICEQIYYRLLDGLLLGTEDIVHELYGLTLGRDDIMHELDGLTLGREDMVDELK